LLQFAIVIPNFNQSRFLPFALESLRCQSVPLNIAVMDGGSTDDFRAAIEPYKDMIAFLRSGPDDGQSAAIREGFDRVPGEIVAWLNADDYYAPGALERVAACFEADPSLDVVYGDAVHVDSDGFFLSYFPPIQEFNAADLMHTCFICQPACFVRRSAYEKVGGVDASLHFTMDWDLWCRLAESGAKFHYLHDVLAAVRYYPGTKTLSGNKRRYREIWQIEKTHGKRVLPLSWPGFYLFDLMHKTKRSIPEHLAFAILQVLRHVKKLIVGGCTSGLRKSATNYGFHKWKNVVEGKGVIYMPWYDNWQPNRLHIRVRPKNSHYKISINDSKPSTVAARRGRILIDLPGVENRSMKMTLECLDQKKWSLAGLSGK